MSDMQPVNIPSPAEVIQQTAASENSRSNDALELEALCVKALKLPVPAGYVRCWCVYLQENEFSKDSIAIAAHAMFMQGWEAKVFYLPDDWNPRILRPVIRLTIPGDKVAAAWNPVPLNSEEILKRRQAQDLQSEKR